jgi:eukaryotic-like serine/threonine-protein kinase
MSLAPGTRVGRYEIRSPLGTGGMGEVYLAQDARLGRPVALKLLREEYTQSREHLRRFGREARAASALNHPNILTIHEIGRAGSAHFIATEFVEGRTLRRALREGRLSVAEALRVCVQVAEGLAAAHRAGVIHRDIKPENVMLRPDGYVKVLDFGLAKLTEGLPGRAPGVAEESTVSNAETSSGAIIGTVSYMSPEQLRGLRVDERTDVWSLGCVLYETVAGRAPFGGGAPADIIVSILEREPPPLAAHLPDCPAGLQSVVTKALTKERAGRYQSVGEMLGEMRRLSRALDADERWSRAGGVHADGEGAVERIAGAHPSAETSGAGGARHTASQNQLTALIRRHKVGTLFAASALAAAALLLVLPRGPFGGLLGGRGGGARPFRMERLTKLVDTGKAVDAAISPDGRFVVYAVEDEGVQSLWTRQVAAASNPVPLVERAPGRFRGLTFTHDGNHLYFVVFEDTINQSVLYRIPALGGTPQRILADVDTAVTLSPDGRQLAFVRGYPEQSLTALMVAKADGTEVRRLAARDSPDDFGWKGGPAWSPDGARIACAVGAYEKSMHVVEVSVADGTQKPLTSRGWFWAGRVQWTKDGAGLVMPARDQNATVTQIWHVSYPGGASRQLTQDLTDYGLRSVTLTADASAVVAVTSDYLSSIWLVPPDRSGQGSQITSGKSEGLKGLSWMPDGRIVYASSANGRYDIWIMNGDGTGKRQLTSDGSVNLYPSASPDGRYIAFNSNRTGTNNIWLMDASGGDLRQLTDEGDAVWPQWSPDGRWVFYKGYATGKRTVWRVPAEGGDPLPVVANYSDWPAVSPDGERLACLYWDEQLTTPAELALFPSGGGATPLKTYGFSSLTLKSFTLPNVLRWKPSGDAVAYIDDPNGDSNILSQPLRGGPPVPLTAFKSGQIFWFDWSRDGKLLACARGTVNSDVVLINAARD